MNLTWLESILYGFVSGLTEFLPVSSRAHQVMFQRVFGSGDSGLVHLMIHIGAFFGLYIANGNMFSDMFREIRLASIPRRRRRRHPDVRTMLDVSLITTAFYLLAIGFMFFPLTRAWSDKLQIVSVFLIFNGLILLLPQFIPSGNKDSRSMTGLDGVLLGLSSIFATLTPISMLSVQTTVSAARGADRGNALRWAFMLAIPAMFFAIGFDIYDIVLYGAGISGFSGFFTAMLCGGSAYLGAYCGVLMMNYLAVNAGFSGFAFYSFGAALFSFILYLI